MVPHAGLRKSGKGSSLPHTVAGAVGHSGRNKMSGEGFAQKSSIPPTVVGGSFQMLSTETYTMVLKSHQRQLVDYSNAF